MQGLRHLEHHLLGLILGAINMKKNDLRNLNKLGWLIVPIIFSFLGCNNNNELVQNNLDNKLLMNSKNKPPMKFIYSQMKVHIEINSSGKAEYTKFTGKEIIVKARITEVNIIKKSASIPVENDCVKFELINKEDLPDFIKTNKIEVMFDYNSFDKYFFKKGDVWRIHLSEKCELVFVDEDS
jgi:hypothetical protein